MDIKFNEIKSQEQFLEIFKGLCDIAEIAFNKFEENCSDPKPEEKRLVSRNIKYLISITLVIMGMRGDYIVFRDHKVLSGFSVEVDGIVYDQSYLYKMNDYFETRLTRALEILQKVDPEKYKEFTNFLS